MAPQVQNSGLARVTETLLALPWWMQWGTGSAAAKTANVVTTAGTTEERVLASVAQGTKVVSNDSICSAGSSQR